jgi:hypothetical protein
MRMPVQELRPQVEPILKTIVVMWNCPDELDREQHLEQLKERARTLNIDLRDQPFKVLLFNSVRHPGILEPFLRNFWAYDRSRTRAPAWDFEYARDCNRPPHDPIEECFLQSDFPDC